MLFDIVVISIGVICIIVTFYEYYRVFRGMFVFGLRMSNHRVYIHAILSIVTASLSVVLFAQVPYNNPHSFKAYFDSKRNTEVVEPELQESKTMPCKCIKPFCTGGNCIELVEEGKTVKGCACKK